MALDPDNLKLTDFMDLQTLQEIQDSFAAVANVRAIITDAAGAVITQPAPTRDFLKRQQAIAIADDGADGGLEGPQKEGKEYVAPIMVSGHRLGTIRMSTNNGTVMGLDDAKLTALGQRFGMDLKQIKALATQLSRSRRMRPAAIQFLFLLANAIARLCFQEYQLRQRINELTAVYSVAMMLADARDLPKVLQRTVQVVCDVMETKAASIRLIDEEKDELVISAVHNLSREYLQKGPVRLSRADIDQIALSPQGYEYVRNMTTDPRVQYPEESRREGVVSMLSVGMRYQGRPIGVLRVYTDEEQTFNQLRIDLLKAVAAQAAAAIENARLLAESIEAAEIEKQLKLAADVQQRMVPQRPPVVPGLDLASIYVPAFTLGGDFFDFIPLPDNNVGLVVADVSGKGVPASLIMASVRAALRSEVNNVYYLYEVLRRLNVMLCRDTKDSEFVTLFYGVFNAATRRLTYCSAGHPPAMLLRDGKVTELTSDNMVLGIDPSEQYTQAVLDLKKNDAILIYTDGLTDGMNFANQAFGRQRIADAFANGGAKGGATAEVMSQNLLWELRKFVGIGKRTDDVTMIVGRVT
ncbi:MAG TPA: SpoIIE family protein phosphatase [Tepidisphaeraceae bacterium]|nr:SpoIIE family protein phosphatase [Tepidisphaeraceae bacterium]